MKAFSGRKCTSDWFKNIPTVRTNQGPYWSCNVIRTLYTDFTVSDIRDLSITIFHLWVDFRTVFVESFHIIITMSLRYSSKRSKGNKFY
jgi:hypothetical protein